MVAAVVLAVAGAVSGCAPDNPPSSATLITLGDQGTAAVTLTFDCGSDLGNTTQILDLLRREGITAAFGVTGRFAELYPAAVRRMIADGHQLINHSYDHPAFTTLSTAQRNQQLDRTEQIFTALGGPSARWFRPPYFDRNAAVDTDLAAHGYYLELLASIDTLGWRVTPRKTTPQEVVTTVLGRLRPGAIILMHVGSASVDYAALAQLNLLGQIRARGYQFTSAAQALTGGAIGAHYRQLGGPRSLLGLPRTAELGIPGGRWQLFQHGRMYWSAATSGHEVHGAILDKYRLLGGTSSFLGYPVTDESPTRDRVGRYNHCSAGSIYWHPAIGAHEVHGAIRARWAALGWEQSVLGYPISDEYTIAGGRRSDFQHGSISWTSATKTTTVRISS